MVTETLGDRKVEASERLAKELIGRGSPVLAAYWEFREDDGRWTLILVPRSPEEERRLIRDATALLVEDTYRSIFSIFDSAIDSRQNRRWRKSNDRCLPPIKR